MSTFVDAIVTFRDGTAPVILDTSFGLQRVVFQEYAKNELDAIPDDGYYTIRSIAELEKLSTIAAKYCPIMVIGNGTTTMPYNISSIDDKYIQYYQDANDNERRDKPLMFPKERQALFEQTDNPQLKETIYRRYAELYNNGKAIYGAQLKNISNITIRLH